jgi:hypothetical protein
MQGAINKSGGEMQDNTRTVPDYKNSELDQNSFFKMLYIYKYICTTIWEKPPRQETVSPGV